MSEQFGTTTGQPVDELTAEDMASAGRRRDVEPGAERMAQPQPASDTRKATAGATDARVPQGGVSQANSAVAATDAGDAGAEPLLAADATSAFQTRWEAIQTAFVDEPRRAVEQADGLVTEVIQRLADTFASERAGLERQWSIGGDVSTEELRLALQRYRSFFKRLLSA